jgi:hypothetical protein
MTENRCDLSLILKIFIIFVRASAVRSDETSVDKELLIYWIFYSSLICVEYLGYQLCNWLMFYWLAKCFFLIWLMVSGTRLFGRFFIQNYDLIHDMHVGKLRVMEGFYVRICIL